MTAAAQDITAAFRNTDGAPPPTMPRDMKQVYATLRAHPQFAALRDSIRFAVDVAESGASWCTKENDAWIRKLWLHLHIGTAI